MSVALTLLLAAIPALIWGHIFYKKDPVYRPKALLTFILGMLAVTPILFYKWSWDIFPALNIFHYTNTLSADVFNFTPYLFLPVGSILAFMFVGVIEEYMKHLVVLRTDRGLFRNIDDSIQFSIMAALGFAFLENVLYFYFILKFQGTEVLLVSFVFRAVFSTFAHILFSGIYGYHYGLAYFADPVWAEEKRKGRHPLVNFLHSVLQLKKSKVFAHEQLTLGLVLAVTLHAIFNIMLEMNLTFFMVPFLIIGYTYLDRLFRQKENLKKLNNLLT